SRRVGWGGRVGGRVSRCPGGRVRRCVGVSRSRGRGRDMPDAKVAGSHASCGGEAPTHTYVAATCGYRTDSITRATTQSRPTATVPLGYIVGAVPSCCAEEPTCIYIGARHRYGIDAIAQAAAESRPTTAIPLGYVGGNYPSCC